MVDGFELMTSIITISSVVTSDVRDASKKEMEDDDENENKGEDEKR